jgi:hypothetical protein
MISDEVFKNALDVALKGQGVLKKERAGIIKNYLLPYYINQRDKLLDMEEERSRRYQAAKKASKKVTSEFEEQAELIHWFRKTYPDIWIYANRNGGTRTPREKVDQIREGVLAGVADLFAPGFMLYVEMKRKKGGIVSDEQIKFRLHVEKFGYTWILGEGFEDAKEKIIRFVENKTLQK